MRFLIVSGLLAFASVACAATPQDQELNSELFASHFSSVSHCRGYIDTLLSQSLPKLASKDSIGELRDWISNHPSDPFSALVLDVQKITAQEDVIDPAQEKDQLTVARAFFDEFGKLKEFNTSGCDRVGSRDVFMDVFYLGLGGSHGRIAISLSQSGIREPSEQKWVLMAALFAGDVVMP